MTFASLLASLYSLVASSRSYINSLKATVATQAAQIDALTKQHNVDDTTIANLQSEVAAAGAPTQAEIDAYHAQADSLSTLLTAATTTPTPAVAAGLNDPTPITAPAPADSAPAEAPPAESETPAP